MDSPTQRRVSAGLLLASLFLLHPCARAGDLQLASPESIELSSQRLQRIDAYMQAEVDAGSKTGSAVLIARNGKIAHLKAFGYANLEEKTPLQTDAYFRVYSMTKPIVSVALLMLYEEGKFQLVDPLEKHIPAFKNVKVYAGDDEAGEMILEAPKRKITIQDVFRHTAGFAHWQRTPPGNSVERSYEEAGVTNAKFESLRELVEDKLPTLPLLYHPGEQWMYSVAHDVQAYLVERFSGIPIDQFLKDRIFEPLGMKDSFYGDPESGGHRCTNVYSSDGAGGLELVDRPLGFSHARFHNHPLGGAGLTMTMMDYARFGQMLLNGGTLNGTRILRGKTVELMTTNHLPSGVTVAFFPGSGYGLGVGVRVSPTRGDNVGSVGSFFWGGAATTRVIMDPKEKLVVLIFSQHMPSDDDFINRCVALTYQAIVN